MHPPHNALILIGGAVFGLLLLSVALGVLGLVGLWSERRIRRDNPAPPRRGPETLIDDLRSASNSREALTMRIPRARDRDSRATRLDLAPLPDDDLGERFGRVLTAHLSTAVKETTR